MNCKWNGSDTPLGLTHQQNHCGGAYDLHSPGGDIRPRWPKEQTSLNFNIQFEQDSSSSGNSNFNFVFGGYSAPSFLDSFRADLGGMLGTGLGLGLMGLIGRLFTPKTQQVTQTNTPQQTGPVGTDVFIPSSGRVELPSITGTTAVQGGGGTQGVYATIGGRGGCQPITGNIISQVKGDNPQDWPKQFVISDTQNNQVDKNDDGTLKGNLYTFELENGKDANANAKVRPQYKCIKIEARTIGGVALNPNDVKYDIVTGSVTRRDGQIITPQISMHLSEDSQKTSLIPRKPLEGVTLDNSKPVTWTASGSSS